MVPGSRRDGRQAHQLRELNISFDGLARVDGSARFGFGDTAALSSISGPIEVRLAAEHPSHATFEVTLRPLSNVPSTESKSTAATIRALISPSLLLSQNPRTLIQLVIQSLSPARGKWKDGLMAAMINASTLALLNAGSISLRGVVCAVPVGRLSSASGPTLVVDPSDDEIASLEGGGCFAFMFVSGVGPNHSECVWSSWKTLPEIKFDEEEFVKARTLGKGVAGEVWTAMKEKLERHDGPSPVTFKDGKIAKSSLGEADDGDDAKMAI